MKNNSSYYQRVILSIISLGVVFWINPLTSLANSTNSKAQVKLNNGSLTLQNITYQMDFGKIQQPINKTTYSITSEIAISDTRENSPGWELLVSQQDKDWSHQLALAINKPEQLLTENSQTIMTQLAGQYPTTQTIPLKIFLVVEPTVSVGQYQANLEWLLTNTPRDQSSK